MSWFKHSPPKYPPNHTPPPPHRSSPITEKSLNDAKKTGPKKK